MGITSPALRLATLTLGALLATTAVASSEESQLVDAINTYRAQVQRCGGQASLELPALTIDPRLILSTDNIGNLQQALAQASYPMVNVQSISLSGPRDAQAAVAAVQESFCRVVLDPQFIDIGVSHNERDWRIVLARPLLSARLGDAEAEGRKLLDTLNAARAQPRQCGTQAFAAAPPLTWSANLASAAQTHARAMANNNFFDHKDREGHTPGDRAELAGYSGQQIGENIAAGQDNARRVVDGWLGSPGHCANIMNPDFRDSGAAYAVDPKSDAGIYWTAMFGAQ